MAEWVGWERPFCMAEVLEGERPSAGESFGNGEKMGWERPVVMAKVVDGERPLVVASFGGCEKAYWERPLVKAKVVEGKRPFSAKLSRNSQRRSQFSQSASVQRFNKFRSGKPAKALVRRPA